MNINRRRLRAGIDALVDGRLKSERVRVPAVPNELLCDFVRGYFEGDGSIFFDEPRSNLHVGFAGLTTFIESLRARLLEARVIKRGFLYRCRQARDTSTLTIGGARAFYLARHMYENTPSTLVLERKRAVYVRALAWRRARGLPLEASHVG